MLPQLRLSFTFTLTYAHNQQQTWQWERKMEGRDHMNLNHNPHTYPRGNQQTSLVSTVPPIQNAQVWTGLSEPQQQMVAAAVVRICQTLAHRPAKPAESERITYEHIG